MAAPDPEFFVGAPEATHAPAATPQSGKEVRDEDPVVLFPHRQAVNAFMQQRLRAVNMTQTSVAARLGYQNSGPLSQLFQGRRLFSRSKHFYALCALLGITVEEREAIQRAEQLLKR